MKKVIALDIGGTNTRCALINENYEIESININPTVSGDVNSFLESVATVISQTVPEITDDIKAISVGLPGRVRWNGYIDELPNVHISHIPLSEFLSKKFSLPVYVKNDAEVAALAEANVGEYASISPLYFITISTGVGGALTAHGKLVNSSYEIGHTLINYKGKLYEFEHLASGTGLVRLAELNGLKISNSLEFFNLVREKDQLGLKVYNEWLNLLASFIEMIVNMFHPKVFTLTGGVMKSADIFFQDLQAKVPMANLKVCSCGQEAGLIGAASVGLNS